MASDNKQKLDIVNRVLTALFWLALALVMMFYGYCKIGIEYGYVVHEKSATEFSEQLHSGDVIEDEFTLSKSTTITDLKLLFVDYAVPDQTGEFRITVLSDADAVLATGAIDVSEIHEWSWTSINLSNPLSVTANQTYRITVEAVDFPNENALSLVRGANGESLAISVNAGIMDAFQKFYILFMTITILLAVIAYIAIFLRKYNAIAISMAGSFIISALIYNIMLPTHLGLIKEAVLSHEDYNRIFRSFLSGEIPDSFYLHIVVLAVIAVVFGLLWNKIPYGKTTVTVLSTLPVVLQAELTLGKSITGYRFPIVNFMTLVYFWLIAFAVLVDVALWIHRKENDNKILELSGDEELSPLESGLMLRDRILFATIYLQIFVGASLFIGAK